jgi:hypothetical protein
MPPEQLPNPFDAFQAELKQTLDARLAALSAEYQSALAEARRTAAQEAEAAHREGLETVEQQWRARLDAEVAAARTEAERRAVAEATKARMEAEQQAAESSARVREELEQALAAERERAAAALREERERAEALLQEERQQAEQELQALRSAAEAAQNRALPSATVAAAQAVSPEGQSAGFERLAGAMRSLDEARSLTEALETLLEHAAAVAGRAVIFIVSGDRLRSWKTSGFPALDAQPFEAAITGTGLLAQTLHSGEATASNASRPAPTFAAVPADRAALALPIHVGDRIVGLLYVDNVGSSTDAMPAWFDIIDAMTRHASGVLALVTASRTVDALSSRFAAPAHETPADEPGARRYARLLVSEIKLYNEPAVRLGREHRDLLTRLASEIDRARQLYEQRVPASLGGRTLFFQQELVQTLAGGDPALLGT